MNFNPLDLSVSANPYPHYKTLRAEAPVYWVESMQGFAVSRWPDVGLVLTDSAIFSSAQFWPALLGEYDPVPEVPPMISLDPPDHVRIRRLANTAFLPAKVASMQEKVKRVAHDLVDDIVARHGNGGQFDFMTEFATLFPVSVIADILGVDISRRVDLKHWVDDLMSAGARSSYGPERLAGIERSSKEIREYFDAVYDRLSANPGDDLISGFIQAEINGQKLTRAEVLNLAVLLLIGGVETTSNLLGNTFAAMKHYPEVLLEVRADIKKVPDLLEEMLRYNAPVQMLFRHTTCDTTLAGVAIPKGSLMMPLLGSANRDEEKYEQADTLMLDRKPREIMSFGQGAHFCIGSYLSRMEARIAVETLLERFEELMPVAETVDWSDSFFARGPKFLPVNFKLRAST